MAGGAQGVPKPKTSLGVKTWVETGPWRVPETVPCLLCFSGFTEKRPSRCFITSHSESFVASAGYYYSILDFRSLFLPH